MKVVVAVGSGSSARQAPARPAGQALPSDAARVGGSCFKPRFWVAGTALVRGGFAFVLVAV